MAKLECVEDLTRFRDQVRAQLKHGADTGTIISIGMGTCGMAAGARETLVAIEQELARRQIDAQVATVGCIGMCVKEPLVDICQAGKPRVLYANIMPEMVPRLIEDHLIKGQPVKEWVIGRMSVDG